jgi:hypothetical protein
LFESLGNTIPYALLSAVWDDKELEEIRIQDWMLTGALTHTHSKKEIDSAHFWF